jgi:excisionase family DNA binding protein
MAEKINNEHLLGMGEAADFLEISKSTLYKLTFRKAIPFYKYGRFVKFKIEDLQSWREARLVEIPTNAQLQANAATYCALGHK